MIGPGYPAAVFACALWYDVSMFLRAVCIRLGAVEQGWASARK